MDYRQKYEKYIGNIPEYYDIHHLNSNKNDNRLMNLIAIPRKLHHQYHWYDSYLQQVTVKEMVEYGKSELIKIEKYFDICEQINKIQLDLFNYMYIYKRKIFYSMNNNEI